MREGKQKQQVVHTEERRGGHGGGQANRHDTKVRNIDTPMVSFFFTRFPVGTQTTELWKVFESFGHVGEVVVPQKVDRWGRNFGFVRFIGVVDVVEMERKLEEVWMGDCRLKVNLARFGKESQQQQQVRLRSQDGVYGGAAVELGKSFKQVLTKEAAPVVRTVVKSQMLVMHTSEDRMAELETCYVGVLTFFREAILVQNSMEMEGLQQIKVTSKGDDLVLLQSHVLGEIERARTEHNTWWKATFKEVKRWSPQRAARRRRVWLRVYGIPLHHIWDESFFKLLGSKYGDFQDFDKDIVGFKTGFC